MYSNINHKWKIIFQISYEKSLRTLSSRKYPMITDSALALCQEEVVDVQSLSCVQLFATSWTAACQALLSFTISWSLLKLMFIDSVMPSNHFILYCLLLLFPSIFPTIGVILNESLHQVAKYWSFIYSISPSTKYSGWFLLGLIVLISLLYKGLSRVFSNKTIEKYQFFCVQPSFQLNIHIYTWLLEKQEHWLYGSLSPKLCFCFLICCLCLSEFFLPRSKYLLISWVQSLFTVILEPKKIKSVTVSIASPSICHEVMGLDATILVFWMLSFKPAFALSSFTLIKRFFSSSSLSAIRAVSSAYLEFIFLLSILILPYASSC